MDININICNPIHCTGCYACFNACNHSAIKMQLDKEGFYRPTIDTDKCVGCKICFKVCPVNTPSKRHPSPYAIYSGWSKNDRIRINSASGGAFTEIASYFIEEMEGVVFGVTLGGDLNANHIIIENKEDLHLLQGSKYIQSIVGETFRLARTSLNQGRNVLYSGTPCQIAGLKNYLGKDYSNLYTIDLICHGIPSGKVFHDYVRYIEDKLKNKVYDVKFRCKKNSWIFFNMAINSHVEKKNIGKIDYEYVGGYYSDPFIRCFLRDNALRPSCYNCKYTSIQRVSDFTLADWWGYRQENELDKNFEKKGVSLIMCNTDKACMIVGALNLELKQRSIEAAMNTNLSLTRPFAEPDSRKTFWQDYTRLSFDDMIKKYMAPEKLLPSLYIYYKIPQSFLRRFLIFICRKYEGICLQLHLPIIKING